MTALSLPLTLGPETRPSRALPHRGPRARARPCVTRPREAARQSIAMSERPPAAAAITVPLATSDNALPVADRPTSA